MSFIRKKKADKKTRIRLVNNPINSNLQGSHLLKRYNLLWSLWYLRRDQTDERKMEIYDLKKLNSKNSLSKIVEDAQKNLKKIQFVWRGLENTIGLRYV